MRGTNEDKDRRLFDTAVVVSRVADVELGGRKWGGYTAGDGNERYMSMEQTIRGQNKDDYYSIFRPADLARYCGQAETFKVAAPDRDSKTRCLCLFPPLCFFLLSGFVFQG